MRNKVNFAITPDMDHRNAIGRVKKASKSAKIIFYQSDKEFIDHLYSIFTPLVKLKLK